MADKIITNKTNDFKPLIEDICFEIIRKEGWKNFNDVDIRVQDQLMLCQPFITLHDRIIHLEFNPQFANAVQKTINKYKFTYTLEDAIYKMMYLSLNHEYAHHKECPITKENMQNILQGSYDVLTDKIANEEKLAFTCFRLHNLFSDTVLNAIESHTASDTQAFKQGFDLMYLVSNVYFQEITDFKQDKAMTLFMNSNHILSQTDPLMMKYNSKRMPKFFLGFDRYLNNILNVFTGDKHVTSYLKQYLKFDNKDKESHKAEYDQALENLVTRFRDVSLWKKMSQDYTELIYPFMKQDEDTNQGYDSRNQRSNSQKQKNSGQSSNNYDKNKSDSGNSKPDRDKSNAKQSRDGEGGKKDKKTSSGDKDDKDQNKSQSSDKEDKKGGGKEDKDKSIDDAANDKDDSKDYMPNSDKGLFKNMAPTEHKPYSSKYVAQYFKLDRMFRERALKIALYAEEQREAPHHNQYLGKDNMPFDEFNTKDIMWSSTQIHTDKDGNKNIELFKRDIPLVLPFESSMAIGGIPDLGFIYDSSYSMKFDPDKKTGEYFVAVEAFYSILKDLEDKGIAPLLNYIAMNFANEKQTVSSGWQEYYSLKRVKEALFDYQSGSTYLDIKPLRELINKRRDNSIIFMLTDTGFSDDKNAVAVLDELHRAKSIGGIGFYLFNLAGFDTPFSKCVEEIGFNNHNIRSSQDFNNLALAFTKELYGGIVK